MKHYIGLDVSMKRTFICMINEQGKIIHEGSENTDPHLIVDYLSKLGLEEMTIGFESGSLTPYLLTGFKEKGMDAICMDARKLSPILALKVNKTDKNDARGIAEALRVGMYTRVHCKPEESINRAILLTSRRALVEQQTHLKNTVRGLLKGYGIRLGAVSAKKFSATVMKRIETREKTVILSIKCLLDTFDKIVEETGKIDKKMLEIANHDKEVQRFMTIPGIGPVTALTYKTEMLGKQVAYVDPRYTSQKCSCCKTSDKKNRNKSKYHCKNCNFQQHADWNAAINIRDNYILSSTAKASEEQAAVNQPYVTIGNNQSQAYCLVQQVVDLLANAIIFAENLRSNYGNS